MPSHPRSAWTRLGELLRRRRIEMDNRYRNRRTFEAERAAGLYRIINDIELGRRDNYEPGTIAGLEAAYGIAPGAIGRALDGDELEVQPVTPDAAVAADTITVRHENPPAPAREQLPPVLQVPDESELAPYLQNVTRDVWRAIGMNPGPGEPPEISEAMLAKLDADLPASRLFAEQHEQDAWVIKGWPPEWRLRLVAIFRHMHAETQGKTGQADAVLPDAAGGL